MLTHAKVCGSGHGDGIRYCCFVSLDICNTHDECSIQLCPEFYVCIQRVLYTHLKTIVVLQLLKFLAYTMRRQFNRIMS